MTKLSWLDLLIIADAKHLSAQLVIVIQGWVLLRSVML